MDDERLEENKCPSCSPECNLRGVPSISAFTRGNLGYAARAVSSEHQTPQVSKVRLDRSPSDTATKASPAACLIHISLLISSRRSPPPLRVGRIFCHAAVLSWHILWWWRIGAVEKVCSATRCWNDCSVWLLASFIEQISISMNISLRNLRNLMPLWSIMWRWQGETTSTINCLFVFPLVTRPRPTVYCLRDNYHVYVIQVGA